MNAATTSVCPDPDLFLCSTVSREKLRDKFKELLAIFGIWRYEENNVVVMLWRDILDRIHKELNGPHFSIDKPIEDQFRRYFYQALDKILREEHIYGDHTCEGKIVSALAKGHALSEDVDAMLAWEDFLASPKLREIEGRRYVYSSKHFGVVKADPLQLNVKCKDSVEVVLVSYAVLGTPEDFLTQAGLCDPEVLGRLEVTGKPKFSYEKTGHVATPMQRRVIERVGCESGVVLRAGTTYHNPNLGEIGCVISRTARVSEFQFQVCDHGDVLKGIYLTKAGTESEATMAHQALNRALHVVLKREGLA
jgi:hypothetical protein